MKSLEKDVIEKTVSRFREGYVCSESILLTFAESNEIKCEHIPKISTGFGGGIGRSGSICGALTGAVMGIGLKYGRSKPNETEAYEKCIAKTLELYKRFEKACGSVYCQELTQCDLTTAEGKRRFNEKKVRDEKCTKYVENAMKILLSLTKD